MLFSYYYNENENENVPTSSELFLEYSDENSDDDNDDEDNENPLINKYTLIENSKNYDCGICFNDYEIDYFKCNRCIFKICSLCYNNYHLKHNVKNCSMCRL